MALLNTRKDYNLCQEGANWICCQLGAREHYAIPRALHRHGILDCLITDLWIPPKNVIGKLKLNLRERFHPELLTANVYAENWSSFAHETRARLAAIKYWPVRGSYWRGRLLRNKAFQESATAALSRIHDQDAPRIVMAHSYMALEILRWARKRGWRTILNQIDPGPVEDRIVGRLHNQDLAQAKHFERPPDEYWALWREECMLADRIVVNSPWSRRALEAEGIPEAKIRVVPLAYELPNTTVACNRGYPREFTRARPLRVLFLGQVNLRKGVGPLLAAIRLLRGEPVEFWFVGPIQIFIPFDLQTSDQVRWIGAVSRESTAPYYEKADVFVFPTFSDGFGLTQLEAQAYKLPVLTTEFCGEVVRDGRTGWVLSDVTPEAIANILRECLKFPDRLQDLSSGSSVMDRFSLSSVSLEWLRVLA